MKDESRAKNRFSRFLGFAHFPLTPFGAAAQNFGKLGAEMTDMLLDDRAGGFSNGVIGTKQFRISGDFSPLEPDQGQNPFLKPSLGGRSFPDDFLQGFHDFRKPSLGNRIEDRLPIGKIAVEVPVTHSKRFGHIHDPELFRTKPAKKGLRSFQDAFPGLVRCRR